MGVAGANMQWNHFSSRQKRESTAIDLILWSAWGLSSPGNQVDRSSTPCRKEGKFGVEKVIMNSGQNIMQQGHRCWKWEQFWKQAQSSKCWTITIEFISSTEPIIIESRRILLNKLIITINNKKHFISHRYVSSWWFSCSFTQWITQTGIVSLVMSLMTSS